MATVDPVAPRRVVMLLSILVLGVGAGGGIAYLLNVLNTVFSDAAQLRIVSGLPVLGVVSMAWTKRARVARCFGAVCCGSLIACLVLAGGAMIVFREFGVGFMEQLLF